MTDPIREDTDRDILLDAIVQRLKACKSTAADGERVGRAIHMLRKVERNTACWDDAEGRAEFLRKVATGLAAKITTGIRRCSLDGLAHDWEALTVCVRAIVTMAPTLEGYLPPRRAEIEAALRRLAQQEAGGDGGRPSRIRHMLLHGADARGIALQLLWAGQDEYKDPEVLRRPLKKVTPRSALVVR